MRPKSLLKIGLSALLIWVVLRKVDYATFQGVLATISIKTASLVVLLYCISQVMSSVKWWLIARFSAKIDVSYPQALKAYFIGQFVNFLGFGLGTLGGDLTRGLLISMGSSTKVEGVASVAVDRVHGLTVLAMIGLLSAALLGASHLPPGGMSYLFALMVILMGGWFAGPKILRIAARYLSGKKGKKLETLASVVPQDPKLLGIITAISICFHLLQISIHAVMAAGVGASVPWTTLLIVIPIVNIASSLPGSWNGVGVRENVYITFLTPALLSKEQALALGALWLFAVTVCSAFGGIAAFLSKDFRELRRPEYKQLATAQ